MTNIIRIGDRVKIINPRFIKRVGYNLSPNEIDDSIVDVALVRNFLDDFSELITGGKSGYEYKNDIPRQIIHALKYFYVDLKDFGGNERKIHYYDENECVKYNSHINIMKVIDKRVVKTGTYETECVDESDYFQGYYSGVYSKRSLVNTKTHVLIKLENGYEIENCDVELIKI